MTQSNGRSAAAYRFPPIGRPEHLEGFLHDSVGCLRKLQQIYGTAVAFRKDQGHVLFAFGPEYNRVLHVDPELFHTISGFPGPKNSSHRRFGNGLFATNGERHQQHRRLLMPPFRKEAVESYRGRFVALTEDLIAGWRPGQVVDMAAAIKDFALRLTGTVLFGLGDAAAARAVEPVFEEWLELSHSVFFGSVLPIDYPVEDYDHMLDAAARLEARLKEVIRQRAARGTDGADLLALLLRLRAAGQFTEAEVQGQLHTLFNAAYHTTTSALTWVLFLLAQHGDVLAELLDDLNGGADDGSPAGGPLPLLDRVIKESLRLLPPVVYAPRLSKRPAELGEYRVPAETMVVCSHYVTHHLPTCYPEPERFLPDRWLSATTPLYAYLPFGAGPRMCLGTPFALLLLKIAVPLIFQRRRLTVVPGTRIDRHATLTLGTRSVLPMVVARADGRFSTSAVEGDIHEMVHLPRPTIHTAAA